MQNSMNTPSYYAILPSDVRYDANLSSSEKLLYAELTALCSKHGYCWASNSYFSELYNVNKNTVSSWVSSLVKRGYIQISVDRSKGNLRKVYLKKHVGIPKKIDTYTEKPEHNNKKNNKKNTNNNKDAIASDEIMELWNKIFKNSSVPMVNSIRNSRLRSLKVRVKENPDIAFWEDYFTRVKSSDFLSGRASDWRATIDWVLSPTNMDKVLDGNYDDAKEEYKNPEVELEKLEAYNKRMGTNYETIEEFREAVK